MTSLDGIQSRVVVTGLNVQNQSGVLRDSYSEVRVDTDAFTINDLWQIDSLPVDTTADSSSGGQVVLDPPRGGLVVRFAAFPPDSEWQQGSYEGALAAVQGSESKVDNSVREGFHQTDTVDIVTVVSGEVVCVLEDGEVVLRQGDTIVMRGTNHAWSNRSDKVASVVATLTSASRTK